jgi:hypothetical protein
LSSANFPLTVITNSNFKINLVCVDADGNNVLTTDTPLFTLEETNITYTNGAMNLVYISNPHYPNPGDFIYSSSNAPNPNRGTYTYQLYLSMTNASAILNSMTGKLTTTTVVNDTALTVQNMPTYIPQSDKIQINQNYTSAIFTIPSASFISLLQTSFPIANSFWKLSLNSISLSGQITRMGVGVQEVFTITLRISEMDNTNQPIQTGICNSFSINFSLASGVVPWNYTLSPSNTIDLWYYNKTPTGTVVLSAFCSTANPTGTCQIDNLTASGLLINMPMIQNDAVITQLST